jgi:Leucine-rich repeat (LRR) protein
MIGKHLKNLRELKIEGNKITDKGFIYICQNLPKLKRLLASRCKITDEGIAEGAKALSNLEFLKISSNHITDEGVAQAVKCLKGLTDMVLLSCPLITLVAADTILRGLPNLTYLRIEFCDQISEEAVERELLNVGHASVSVFSCIPGIFESLFSY